MRIFNPFSSRRVDLFADGFLRLRSCFAGLDALVPSVIKFRVASTSALSEPRTSTTATTNFARFPNVATSGAHGTDDRRRVRWCLDGGVGQRNREK